MERFQVMSFEVWPQMWTTDMDVGHGHWRRGSQTPCGSSALGWLITDVAVNSRQV